MSWLKPEEPVHPILELPSAEPDTPIAPIPPVELAPLIAEVQKLRRDVDYLRIIVDKTMQHHGIEAAFVPAHFEIRNTDKEQK